MNVPLLDLKAQFAPMKNEIMTVVEEIFDTQYFILGPTVSNFEKKCAKYVGTEFALGVSSGTDALIIALMALDIKPGDEIITTPYTFFATAGSIARLGAKPVFVDIDPKTYNIDVTKIEAVITDKTKAIIPVHLYGQCVDIDPIIEIAKKNNLSVVEDAAQAIGSKNKKRNAGTFGEFGCFSFFPSKEEEEMRRFIIKLSAQFRKSSLRKSYPKIILFTISMLFAYQTVMKYLQK